MNAEAPHPIRPGVTVGRYRILTSLGSGAMGEVFRAEDTVLGRTVAIKALPRDFVATPERLARFHNEGRVMASLSHPNLVQVYDVGEVEGIPYLVQEFIDGETLEEVLLAGAVQPWKAARWLAQAAEGLAAVHAAGILHRDIKPANVMVRRDGLVKVLDFGLAKVRLGDAPEAERAARRPSLTTDGLVVGTAHYMSPEQAMGRKVDERSDVFSLGTVLYELLAGKPPFDGTSAVDVMYGVIHLAHAPLHDFQAGVLRPFAEIVDRALAKDPAARYGSMRELADALDEAVRGGGWEEDGGTPATGRKTMPLRLRPTERIATGRWRQSRRGLWGAVAAAGAVALLAVAAFLARRRGHPAEVPFENLARPVQVTSSPGLDVFPSFSPDGRSIAYSSDRGGSFEIYRLPLGTGGREIQVTSDGLQNLQPAWSPDGETIAYHAKKVGGVWVVPATGGVPRQLTTFGARPAWFPDGKTIVFESGPVVDLAANSLGSLPPSILWIVPASGGTPHPLTKVGVPEGGHGAPSVAPDGSRIAFASYARTTSSVWSIRPDGTDLVLLSEGTGYCYDPVYGADGVSVHYPCWSETWSAGIFERPLVRGTGKPSARQRELKTFGSAGLGSVKHLALSRDGKRVAYASLSMQSNLWEVPVDAVTGEPRGEPRAVTRETGRSSRPAVSPDGTKLALSRWRPGANQDVWIVDADGRNGTQRTTDPGDEDYPFWLPGGKRLAYMSVRKGYRSLFAVDLLTNREEPFADFGPGHDAIRLSPDTRRAAFHSQGSGTLNVFVADVPSGKPVQLTFDKELMAFPCWSPDGETLAFEVRRGGDTHIATVPSRGGEPVQLTDRPGQSWPYSFSPDGRRIAFAGLRDGLWDVFWVEAKTRRERPVTRMGRLNSYIRYPDWSPRGDRIVFELAETLGNIWLLQDQPAGTPRAPVR